VGCLPQPTTTVVQSGRFDLFAAADAELATGIRKFADAYAVRVPATGYGIALPGGATGCQPEALRLSQEAFNMLFYRYSAEWHGIR
jgi:hypothetical protein